MESRAHVAKLLSPYHVEVLTEHVKADDDQVLVEMQTLALSGGSDMNLYRGVDQVRMGFNPELPCTIASGDTGVGVIRSVGQSVRGFSEGDRVVTGGLTSMAALPNPDLKVKQLIPVPRELDEESVAFLHQIRVALNAVRRARIVLGDTVIVIGLGVIGNFAAQLAKMAGASQVIGVDLYPLRLKKAESVGVDYALSADLKDLHERIDELTNGKGADIIIDASGSPKTFDSSFRWAAYMGRIVVLGWITRGVENLFLGDYFHFKQLEIISSQVRYQYPGDLNHVFRWTEQENYDYIFALIKEGRLRTKELITHRFRLKDVKRCFEVLDRQPQETLGILFRP